MTLFGSVLAAARRRFANAPSASGSETRETCVSAAVRDAAGRVFAGRRHSDAMRLAWDAGAGYIRQDQQGFLTDRGRFVGREEGYRLQVAAGIQSAAGGYRSGALYSEDLAPGPEEAA